MKSRRKKKSLSVYFTALLSYLRNAFGLLTRIDLVDIGVACIGIGMFGIHWIAACLSVGVLLLALAIFVRSK